MHATDRPAPGAAVLGAVAAGGAVGACARAALQHLVPAAGGFPWATFAVNVSGTLLLAVLVVLPAVHGHRLLGPLLGTGVLGGYTTLSAWSEECRALLAGGHTGTAAAYLVSTLAACLAVVGLVRAVAAPGARP